MKIDVVYVVPRKQKFLTGKDTNTDNSSESSSRTDRHAIEFVSREYTAHHVRLS